MMEPPVVRKGTKVRVGEMGVGGAIATFLGVNIVRVLLCDGVDGEGGRSWGGEVGSWCLLAYLDCKSRGEFGEAGHGDK